MDENSGQPTPPINTDGNSTDSPDVSTNPADIPNTPAETEGGQKGVVEGTDKMEDTGHPGSPTPGGASETVSGSTDISITNTIRERLSETSLPSATRVELLTKDGVVTVGGQVSTDSEMNQILQVIKGVPGVRQVVNQLSTAK